MALWEDLGPARLHDYHELHEYIVGDMHLLASPKDLLLTEKRIAQDDNFAELIEAFNNPRTRKIMFARMWQFIYTTIEYKLKTESALFAAAWGTRGMGKSEVLAAIILRLIKAYHKYTIFRPRPALARNDSEGNTKLSKATEEDLKIVLHIDEVEREMSTSSKTEADAMVSNLETIRVLQHSVLRCTIKLQKIIGFAEQCDFVLHTLFQDRMNEINYCMVYVIDDMTGYLEPMGIVDVPLHKNRSYRKQYRALKEKDQEDFTKSFGRTSPLLKRINPVIDSLVDYIFDQHKEKEISRYGDLEADLIDEDTGVGGGILNGDERRIAMKIAFKKVKKRRKKKHKDEEPDEILKGISWGSEFTWRSEIATLMRDHPQWKDYYPFFVAKEVELLKPNRDAKAFSDFTKKSKTQNYRWLKKIDQDTKFQGWLKDQRARLHEAFVAQRLRAKGFVVKEKPKFTHEHQAFEEDLLVTDGKSEVWINCKCGSGMRTYVNSEYKTTFILHQVLKKEAYILYLDLETMHHHIYLPTDSVAVGSKSFPTIMEENIAKLAKSSRPSTPYSLMRALAEDESEASNGKDGMEPEIPVSDDGNFVDSIIALAKISGLDIAEKTVRKKGLKESTVKELIEHVRQELDRDGSRSRV